MKVRRHSHPMSAEVCGGWRLEGEKGWKRIETCQVEGELLKYSCTRMTKDISVATCFVRVDMEVTENAKDTRKTVRAGVGLVMNARA